MVCKTLRSLLIVSSVAVVPVAFAEGTSTGSEMGSGSGTSGGSMGSDTGTSPGMGSGTTGTTGSGAYDRECITDAQKRTQRCQDLLREQGGAGSGMGTDAGTGTGTDSGMGTGGGSGGSMGTP